MDSDPVERLDGALLQGRRRGLMAIRICTFCDAVHDANDFDEDWAVNGCPKCDNKEEINHE